MKNLSDLTLGETNVLVSFDVTAFCTKVSIDKSLSVILDHLENDSTLPSRTKLFTINTQDILMDGIHLSRETMEGYAPQKDHGRFGQRRLISICLKTTYFVDDSKIYTSVKAAAMGSSVNPIMDNLYTEWFEETALQSFQYNITMVKRYANNTFVTLYELLIDEITKHINLIDPAIKFTREEEVDQTLPM